MKKASKALKAALAVLLLAGSIAPVSIKISNKSKSARMDNLAYDEEKGIYTCSLNDMERSFILCLPENYSKETKLVLMLHGLNQSAQTFKDMTHFEQAALPRNYAVIYADGTVDPDNRSHGKGWHFYENDFSTKDIDFLVNLVSYIQITYKLNDKVFVAGFSNGGFMVNKLASYRPDIFTAAASVAGMMPKNVWEGKKSKNPCPYLQINGTKDDVVPMDLTGSSKYSQNPSIEKVLEYYRQGTKSPKKYSESKLSAASTMYSYGTKVAWVIIDGGYHGWPEPQFAGIEPAAVILDFFDKQ